MMDNTLTVAVIDNQFIGVPYIAEIEQQVFGNVAKVVCFGAETNKDIPVDKLKEVDAILAWHHLIIDENILSQMSSRMRVIVRIGMGFDNVDIQQAGKRGIVVSNVPDYGVDEVADTTLCFILNLMRRMHVVAIETKQNHKWSSQLAKGAIRLHDKVLGIIGLGRIGTAVALRAKAFGLRVIFYDPHIEYGRAKSLGIHKQVDTLEELLSQSDIISVHCPLNHQTQSNKHLINKDNIQHIKKGSLLINTARGPIVEEEALVTALKTGCLAGAGLDVFENEPQISPELYTFENVIMTPHTAFYSEEGVIEMRRKAAEEAKRVLLGQRPHYCVNKQFLSN